ncbi:helix-turn-helix transcriptional regulator [Mycolicibacterium sp. P1-18]|uniref:ATP-binding protein n=1 Tax=Mycolicibacterium sp. P1-18 TaxID=2024615 RepID=UPI0011F377F7|nr:LuxR family transcriptional regulator [Mycolicibacterium sp. P1-18]KAA0091498.1 helix-turn-helix transcriptional regulator [Mycolicibacterium sp. P1-18]
MVGRATELAVVTESLSAVATRGAALVVDGDPGIGKSTLLEAAIRWATANGYGQLGCAGLQSHTEMGFAGLHELVHPLLAHSSALPPRQESALLTAFGLADGPAPDRLLVSLAVLGLLEEAACRRRLLLIVDDAQWLDQSTLDVLTFVARRLTNAPLMMLCATRTPLDGSTPPLDGLPRLSLGPLPRDQAAELLAETLKTAAHDVDAYARRRVLEQADGNPLAVIELAATLGDQGADAALFAGEPLPTSRRVERAFLSQLQVLPDDSRLLLLLISASDGIVTEIAGAAARLGLNVAEHLAPLEASGLITLRGGTIRLRHPLIRSTAYGAAALSSRSTVHRALADAVADPTSAAWHRAEASFGPDEDVAADLERAADRARARGAGAEATAALRRAAMLTPGLDRRVERLAAAANVARSSGLIEEAIRILQEAQPLAEPGITGTELAITRFVLNATAAIPGQSADELVALAGKQVEGDPRQRELLWAAAIECRMHGLPEDSRMDVAAAIRRVDDSSDPLLAIGLALVDDVGEGARLRARLPQLTAAVADQPLLLLSLGMAAEAVADRDGALRCYGHVQRQARANGSPANECEGLRGEANILLTQGRIRAATTSAENALNMAEAMNLPMTSGSAAAILSRAQAWLGQPDLARHTLDRARHWLARDPTMLWHDDVHWAAGLAALCESNHAEALGHLTKMSLHRTSVRWAIADVAEAAAGCGQAEAVRPLVAAVADQAASLGVNSFLVHRARALVARCDTEADDHFTASVAAAQGPAADLEVARTHLLYGEWLRRRRRIVDARAHLSVALTAFDTAGATPFANRAASELRAAGVAASPSPAASGAAGILTSQELQIAQLAAAGMTNREIADRIYLSHRTVAAHLYKVFPKLGITRRNQLHGALGAESDVAGAPTG